MKIHNYNPATGEYLSTADADVSPADKPQEGASPVFLVPAHATTITPPKASKGKALVFDSVAQAWKQVTDNRGAHYDTANGDRIIIRKLGEDLPAGKVFVRQPPSIPGPAVYDQVAGWVPDEVSIASGKAARVRADRDVLLMQADHMINRAEDAGEATAQLREYRQALRDLTKQSGFPDTVTWPTKPV